jgi:hypothetical protein
MRQSPETQDKSAAALTKAQATALKSLLSSTGFRVNWRYENYRLSRKGYLDLVARKLIEEHWTWASSGRPDIGITDEGRNAALTAAQGQGR